jgi:mono/diheme cytochrome c family protein
MQIIKLFAIAVIIGVIVVLGYVYSGLYDVSATSPHGGLANWVLSTTMHASVDRRAKDIDVPNLDDEALQLSGINDFDAMCAACHGAPGRDPQAMGQGLNPPAPDLTKSAAHRTAAELFWVTKHGIKMTGMPAWSASHDDEDLWPVVAFMTVLPKLSADAYQSMLARAAGSGHHAADDVSHSHSDAAIESSGHHNGVQSHQDQSSSLEVTDHSHLADSHGDNESAGEKKIQLQEHDHGGDDHEH